MSGNYLQKNNIIKTDHKLVEFKNKWKVSINFYRKNRS